MIELVSRTEIEAIKKELESDLPGIYAKINRGEYLDPVTYKALTEVTRESRMEWWDKARFGLFLHYGIYSARGKGEWELAWNAADPDEYEKSAADLCYRKGSAEQWVQKAKEFGAGYVILTTRHHDGFSLWDSDVNPYNSVNYGPKIDIIREFSDACHRHGMKMGFYFSLMDWHNPDCADGIMDSVARERFTEYLYHLGEELLTRYGKVDILWYDMPHPYEEELLLNSNIMNQRFRALQPHLIINNRANLEEDFTTPEENFRYSGKHWETCLTNNEISWGYIDESQECNYQYSPQQIIQKLAFAARNCGNLLLNLGPMADGTLPPAATQKLLLVGKWLRKNGSAIYGIRRPCNGLVGGTAYGEYGANFGAFITAAENTVYALQPVWPCDGTICIAGYDRSPIRVYDPATDEDFRFTFEHHRITMTDLPRECPDKTLGIGVIAMEFDSVPRYRFCGAYPHINNGNRAYSIK